MKHISKLGKVYYTSSPEKAKINHHKYRHYSQLSFISNRRYKLKKFYGLTEKDYQQMVVNQEYKCAICGKSTKLYIDHDHQTKKIRGLLCNRCNMVLGNLDESKELALKIIKYLEIWK